MSVPWVSFATPFLLQTGTGKELRGSAAARGRSSPESVPWQGAGPDPLSHPQCSKTVSRTPPAVTKAIFLLITPEPKTDLAKGSSGLQRRVLAPLGSLRLGQKLPGCLAPWGHQTPVPSAGRWEVLEGAAVQGMAEQRNGAG